MPCTNVHHDDVTCVEAGVAHDARCDYCKSIEVYVYEVLINLNMPRKFFDAKPTDAFLFTYRGSIMADSPESAAWAVVAIHNWDNRPDGKIGPSFSAGDIVSVFHAGQRTFFLSNGMDLTRVSEPDRVQRDAMWEEALRGVCRNCARRIIESDEEEGGLTHADGPLWCDRFTKAEALNG